MERGRHSMRTLVLLILDVLCIVFSAYAANIIRHGSYDREEFIIKGLIQLFLFSYVLVYLFINPNKKIAENGLFAEFISVITTNLILLFSTIGLLYFTRFINADVSRAILGYIFLVNSASTYVCHLLVKLIMSQFYINSKNKSQLIIVCKYDDSFNIINKIYEYNKWDYKLRGLVITDGDYTGKSVFNVPVIATADNVIEYCKKDIVDEVLFFTDNPYSNMKEIITTMTAMGITVHININSLNFTDGSAIKVSSIGDYSVLTFAYRFLSFRQVLIKRIIDICFSLVGSLITLILVIILGPIIKAESPGPIFFKQKRVGKNGRYFYIYKFRSMYMDAEERKKALMEQNEMGNDLMFKMENDPRVTKVGAFLRKTSLDEFPQFFNILKGDMSLIGTRPPTVDEFEKYQSYHKMRLSIKPGLTGLWQVSGRSDITDFEEIVKLDVKYINEWRLSLDIKIILKTIYVVLFRKGAK